MQGRTRQRATQGNANNQTQTDNVNIAAALFGDPDSW